MTAFCSPGAHHCFPPAYSDSIQTIYHPKGCTSTTLLLSCYQNLYNLPHPKTTSNLWGRISYSHPSLGSSKASIPQLSWYAASSSAAFSFFLLLAEDDGYTPVALGVLISWARDLFTFMSKLWVIWLKDVCSAGIFSLLKIGPSLPNGPEEEES